MRMVWLCVVCLFLFGTSQGQQKAGEFSRPVDQFAYAQGLKRGAIYDFAEKAFADFIRLYPGHDLESSAWSELIDCLRRQEKHDAMLSRIESFRKKWPHHRNEDLFIYWSGVSYYQRKKYALAGRQFQDLVESKNEFLRECAMYLLADCLLRGGPEHHPRAYELLTKVGSLPLKKKRPYRENAAFVLGRYYQQNLKFDEARKWYQKLSDAPQATPVLREEAMYMLGEICYALHEYSQATQAYDRYLIAYSKGKWSGEVRKRRAQATYMQKRFDDALKQVLEWRKAYPGATDYEMDTLHGRCLYQLGEYSAAQAHFAVVVSNEDAPVSTRRFCLVQSIYCLLQETTTAAWQQGLDNCTRYFRNFRDIKYESTVQRYQGLLEEKLGRYEQAVASFGKALQGTEEKDKDLRRGLILHQVQCLAKMEAWAQAAGLLRKLADPKGPGDPKARNGYLLSAGELEMRGQKDSPRGERDFLAVLKQHSKTKEETLASHERLLEIYLQRKDVERAHGQLDALIPLTAGERQEIYLYKDSLLLIELGREDEAAQRLRQALGKARFTDEKREVGMRLAMLSVLQSRVSAGDHEAAEEMIEQYRHLAAKPEPLTEALLTPGILYQMALLIDARVDMNPTSGDRVLLENTYARAVSKGYEDAAAFFAAYRLGKLYMEPADGRFGLAEKVLRPMTDALRTVVNAPDKHEELLRQLDRGENLLRDSLALLAECHYQLKQDLDALAVADQVLRRGMNYGAAKRCLLIQAKIYYYRTPRKLDKALEKLARYQYTLSGSPVEAAEEEEVMVLLVNVQRELKRHEGARQAYRQLKVRYPKRAEREAWAKEYESEKMEN